MDNFNILVSGGDQDDDLVQDGWTDIFRNLTGIAAKQASRKLGRRLTPDEKAELMELADFQKMESVRARVDEHRRRTRRRPRSSSRGTASSASGPASTTSTCATYNRPNVHAGRHRRPGREQLTEHGVVVDGNEYEVDCLIFATGFEVGTTYTRRAGYDIIGRDGVTLSREVGRTGCARCTACRRNGFPNCFFLGFTQTAVTVSVPHALNEQATHVDVHPRRSPPARGARRSRPPPRPSRRGSTRCATRPASPSGSTPRARPATTTTRASSGTRTASSPASTAPARSSSSRLLDEWRADGQLEGVELR